MNNGRWFWTCLSGIGIAWLTCLLLMPAAPHLIDELIQISGFSALKSGHGFWVQNGIHMFDSDALKIILLERGLGGLTIQYPSGFSFLAYPFYALGGIRGVYFLNFIAGVICVYLTYRIARLMVDQNTARIAVLLLSGASFLVDYSAAIWPHNVATAIILFSIYCVAKIKLQEERGAHPGYWAFLGGLAIGLGLSIRLDVILVAPPILIWTLWYCNQPFKNIGFASLGLLPGLLFCSVLNGIKFGVWLPLSYGASQSGPGTTFDTYLIPIAGIAALLAFTYLIRLLSSERRHVTFAVLAVAAIAALVLYEPLANRAVKLLWGVYFLIFNMANHPETDVRSGVLSYSPQSTLFWGAFKQALGQSLPWLGLVPLAIASVKIDSRWKSLIVLVSILLPLIFLMQIWHGGKSNSQRYLLPIVPLVSIMGAVALSEIAERRPLKPLYLCVALAACFVGLNMTFLIGGLPLIGLVEQPLATALFCICLAFSIIAVIWRAAWLYRFMVPVAILAIAFSTFSAFRLDISFSAFSRARNAKAAEAFRDLPPNTILYGWSVGGAHEAFENDGLIIANAYPEIDPDAELVQAAFSKGWNIATTQKYVLQQIVELSEGARVEKVTDINSRTALWIAYPPPDRN